MAKTTITLTAEDFSEASECCTCDSPVMRAINRTLRGHYDTSEFAWHQNNKRICHGGKENSVRLPDAAIAVNNRFWDGDRTPVELTFELDIPEVAR